MLVLPIILPLFSFILSSLLGVSIGAFGANFLTVSILFFSVYYSIIIFFKLLFNNLMYKLIFHTWIFSDNLELNWTFCFDSLTLIMLLVVTLISTFVHLYSVEYMLNDPHVPRFMSYLSFFTFFMLMLITANNFLQMFIGWEGVGLCSFLLINFWFTRLQANKAAIKAMLLNRIGDFFLLLSLFFLIYVFNSLDYEIIFSMSSLLIKHKILFFGYKISFLDLLCFFLFLGAIGKSAQIGLHTWLPDAMEGPTPVSALIHAATMVTAGIFLIIRCSFLFELSRNALNLIIIFGSLTAVFAATTGLFQNDIKRVIAYSTCSQLGYMTFACGLSQYDIGLFHLTNHAFFKALLFLGAGSIIHALSDEQDIRKMGGLQSILPFSYAAFLIGSLALIGFPFLAGFYSKDIILEMAFVKQTYFGFFSYILGIIGVFCTSFYSTRLLLLVFLMNPTGNKNILVNAHESIFFIRFSLIALMILSILSGYIWYNFFIGFGNSFWLVSIFILPENYLLNDIEFISSFYKILPLCTMIFGVVAANLVYFNINFFYRIKQMQFFKYIYFFLIKKWYFDRIYNEIISQNVLHFSYFYTYKSFDRGLLELFGPFNSVNLFYSISNSIKNFQSGYIYHYLFLFLIFIVLMLSINFFLFSFLLKILLCFFILF